MQTSRKAGSVNVSAGVHVESESLRASATTRASYSARSALR